MRCLIVDDNAAFLRVASALLEREGATVVGQASNGSDAVRQARELQPEVVLVDIALGAESGFDVARELARNGAGGPAVILISTHAEADFADLIEHAPVAGFVAKSDLSTEAIRRLVA